MLAKSLLTIVPLLAALVSGHTTFTTLYVDGDSPGDGVCVRMNHDAATASYPIYPVSSKDVACGIDGEKAAARVCPAKDSSLLTFEFRLYPDGEGPGSIDISHKGPCAVYMKKVADATEDNNAAGDGWFKIWQQDYDASAGKWCTEKLIDHNGLLSVRIPKGIASGYYLVRPELLALHNADASPPDPQFYVGCAQIFVEGDGTAYPETVSIGEGTYHLDMPGLTFNIYEQPLQLPYPMFGPPVYQPKTAEVKAATVKVDANTKVANPQRVQEKGLKPEGCILVRDNWCGFEVPAYDSEDSCWSSSEKCWEQSDVCWNTDVLPTGSSVCQIWQDKCTAIDEGCNDGQWQGPPHQGQDLTPKARTIDASTHLYAKASKRDRHMFRRFH